MEVTISGTIILTWNLSNIRAVNRGGSPWFVLWDIGRNLGWPGYGGASQAVPADEKAFHPFIDSLGRLQDFRIVNPAGIERLIGHAKRKRRPDFIAWLRATIADLTEQFTLPPMEVSMNDIVPFNFESQPIRIEDRNGEPWFVASDVCAVLDIANHRDAVGRLDDDEKGVVVVDTPGGPQSMTAVNEAGLYRLVFASRKASAKRFSKWVISVVLPSIRKTGSYGAPAPALDLSDPATLQSLLIDLTGRTLDASERIARLEPKAEALDRLTDAQGSMCMTDSAKVLGVPPRRLVAWMEANKWIYRRADAGSLVAFGAKLDAKLLEHKGTTIQRRGAPDKWVQQVMVTPKGLARLGELKAGQ